MEYVEYKACWKNTIMTPTYHVQTIVNLCQIITAGTLIETYIDNTIIIQHTCI